MKDSEFIELLNLYLDHEISPADAARLEAEVQGNPARRRVYREYCQMQKACKVLATDFQTEPQAAPAGKVIDFRAAQQRQQRSSVFYTVGALTAAAACIAIVVIGRNQQPGAPAGAPQAPAIARVQPPATTVRQPVAPPQYAVQVQPTLVNAPLTLTDHARARALEATATEPAAAQFAWLQDFRLKPLHQSPANANAFDARDTSRPNESPTYNSTRPLDSNVMPMVTRFQK